jgi:hypothetical protein
MAADFPKNPKKSHAVKIVSTPRAIETSGKKVAERTQIPA